MCLLAASFSNFKQLGKVAVHKHAICDNAVGHFAVNTKLLLLLDQAS